MTQLVSLAGVCSGLAALFWLCHWVGTWRVHSSEGVLAVVARAKAEEKQAAADQAAACKAAGEWLDQHGFARTSGWETAGKVCTFLFGAGLLWGFLAILLFISPILFLMAFVPLSIFLALWMIDKSHEAYRR